MPNASMSSDELWRMQDTSQTIYLLANGHHNQSE